ncbi:MAG TPA: hypothetical protein VIU15_21850, partial [Streptomyces sp.]
MVLSDKLAANAVTVGKLPHGTVTLTALGGTLRRLHHPAPRRHPGRPGGLAGHRPGHRHHLAAPDRRHGRTHRTAGEARGFVRLRGTTLIPYEPGVLYRLSARVRATAQLPSGADSMYVGVLGIGADGTTLVNRLGADSANSHYYAAASALPVPASSGWITVTGYLKGRAPAGSPGSAGPN